jgi:hypothetical protein
MKNYYSEIVLPEPIVAGQSANRESVPPKINAHIHSPYSFSAFENMEQPFEMANSEHIVVLGINDFYTTDGYDEFASLAKSRRIFPLFNIEFMALQKNEQAEGIRINDPQNPGRTYLSGKGLRYPVVLSDNGLQKLQRLQSESNRQTYQMVDKLNQFLETTSTGIHFNATALHGKLARNLFRERHIATAVRLAVVEKFVTEENIYAALTEIFSGKTPKSSVWDVAALENEIRNNLLKAGGPAYVPEDEKAFLSLREVIEFIIDAGGIPCYPVLLDDAKGNFTDFEGDFQMMANALKTKGIFMIELIPGRNDYSVLKDFVRFFDQQGFGITFGSEHNTPQLDPLTITCRGGIPLDDELMQISYKGAALIAAHQFLIANGKPGFPVYEFPSAGLLTELEGIGKQVIMNFIK